jgi:dihydrofolate reductase
MRTVVARIFDYSLDGFVAGEDTDFFQFCRDLPDDQASLESTLALYESADVHIMGRKHYEDAARYFPDAVDHPYADVLNAARKVVFSTKPRTADWAGTTVSSGDLGAGVEELKREGDGVIVAHGGLGFWRSLGELDLIDEYRLTLFPYVAGNGQRVFANLGKSPRLELVSATPFGNGTLELRYRRIR